MSMESAAVKIKSAKTQKYAQSHCRNSIMVLATILGLNVSALERTEIPVP